MSLGQFIQKTIEAEHQIEAYRIQMANIQEFEPNTVYKRLDQPRLGGVKIADLADFANDHALVLPNDALNYLFNYFDVDEDGIITREDFLKVVLSRENLKLADEVQQREPYEIQVAMFLPHDVEEALIGFFMIILDNYQQLQQINLEGINLDNEKIFDRDGFITIQSLSSYLQQQNIEIDDYAIIPFIQLLDKNEIGKATQDQLQKYINSVRAQEEEYNEQQFEPYEEEPLEQSQENLKDTIKREQIPVEQENESDESQKPAKQSEPDKQQQEKQQVKQQQPPQSQQINTQAKRQEVEKQIKIDEKNKNQQQDQQQKEMEQRKAQQEQFKQDSLTAKQQLEDDKKKNVKQEKEQSIQQPQQEENKYNSQQTFKPNQSKVEDKEDKEDKNEQKSAEVPQSYYKNDGLLELYYREIQREKERQQILDQEIDYVKGLQELYKQSPQKSKNQVLQSPQKKDFKAESEIDLQLQDIERRRRELQFEIELEKSKQKYLPQKQAFREPFSSSLERINFQIDLEIQRIKRISEQNHKQQPANDILSMSNTGILDKINKQYPLTTPSRDYMKASDEITPPKDSNEEISKDKFKPLKYQQEKILVESQEMK